MTDLAVAAGWLGVLAAALGCAVALRAFGVAATYVRDLLHIGAGIWVLGWPYWHAAVWPTAIVLGVAIAISVVPVLASRSRVVARVQRSVTSDDEHWNGLVLYTSAYAIATPIGLLGDRFPAAAALLALSLGDGIGGAVGRRFGSHRFHAPGGKLKTFEGSLVVATGAFVGALIAARIGDVTLAPTHALALAAVAAVAEGIAPRGTDNLLVPAAVYATAHLVT